jgi:hypothetical protein
MESNSISLEEIFMRYGFIKKYDSGRIIFQKGDPADFIYYLVDGKVWHIPLIQTVLKKHFAL